MRSGVIRLRCSVVAAAVVLAKNWPAMLRIVLLVSFGVELVLVLSLPLLV